MNIKHILAPTDFSDSSETAVSFAVELALDLKADLCLMNSMQSTYSISSEKLLDRLLNDYRFQEIKTQTVTEIGDPSSAILRQIKELKADLVVMGSKGSAGGRKFLGSTTTEVISKSEVPVLAIPQNSRYSGFEDIIFMTDFNEQDIAALNELIYWARYFEANLHVLHLFTDDSLQDLIKFRGFKEIAKEQLDYDKLTFERVFNASFSEGFFDYMKTRATDLVVLPRYKKSFFQKLIEQDHAQTIEHNTIKPLLNLPVQKYAEVVKKDKTIKS